MADEVAAAREKLIEAAADVDDAIASAFLEGQPIEEAALKAAHPQGDHRLQDRPGAGRRGAAQQGGAAAARRGLRLPAVAARGAAGDRDGAGDRGADQPPARRRGAVLARWRSRSRWTRGARRSTCASTRACSSRATRCRTRARAATRRWRGCSACTPTGASGSSARAPAASWWRWASRTRGRATRWRRPKAPIILERIDIYEPVISRAIEPKTQAEKEKLDFGLTKLADEDPTFRWNEDAGDGPDDHPRHGRAAPRHHRRPAAARVRRRGERGAAAGRLPRDAGQAGRRRGALRARRRGRDAVRPRARPRRAARAPRRQRADA